MGVALDGGGHVEVDDEADVGDVDTAAGEVGGDEDVGGAIPHGGEGGLTLLLGLGAVQGD